MVVNKSYVYRDYVYSEVRSKDSGNCKTVLFISPEGVEDRGAIYSSSSEEFHSACQNIINTKWNSRAYDLHSNFDVQKHKETYINYLEVIITATGKVCYAVPSHQMKLEEIACSQKGITRDELLKICPRGRWLDYNDWLMETTNCISVWTNFYTGKANEYQLAKLEELKEAGIYLGGFNSGYTL